ncbi:MAG: Eco47II family restriction endonuclease [Saprospiraceae bacterium]|jgi:hypothetical protein
MAWLPWIEDHLLENEVAALVSVADRAKIESVKDFNKNVIDPFAALFEMVGFDFNIENWRKSEITRQAQKSLQNQIGNFHQNILGSVRDWENLKTKQVIDLKSDKRRTIAEIKNKYNTVSGGKLSDLYDSLDGLVSQKASKYKGYTAYYVAIIPKMPDRYNKTFTPSKKETGNKCPQNELIREIDGASFYSLVTGHDTALKDLFYILPQVISKLFPEKGKIEQSELRRFFHLAYH